MIGVSRWIAENVPGLDDDPDLYVRRGQGIGQIIQTPEDLSATEVIEDDLPYAGTLGLANSWTAFNDKKMNTFQIYVGVLGPPSLAEEVQTFVHVDMGLGDEPMGWDNQLDTELLLNLNYGLGRKLGTLGNTDGFSADLSVGGSASLGNLFTQAQAGLETRIGWRVPRGFTPVPDMAGRGIIVDPVLEDRGERPTRFYLTFVARSAAIGYTVLLDGNTFEDSHSIDYDPYVHQLISGTHLHVGDWRFHFNIYFSSNPAEDTSKSDLTWGNFSIEKLF